MCVMDVCGPPTQQLGKHQPSSQAHGVGVSRNGDSTVPQRRWEHAQVNTVQAGLSDLSAT